jgi:tRNA threonylcarbamoyl adenosine modification protein YeaZ
MPRSALRFSTVLLLAFDTATPAVTVALHDGAGVIAEETVVDARRHGELLAVLIERILADAGASTSDLGAIAVGTGPGPYTGLRAGLITARVLGSALGVAVHGACTLDVIAREAAAVSGGARGWEFIVATDARRREVYWARYSPAGRQVTAPAVGAPADIDAPGLAAGEGPLLYPCLGDPIPPRYPAARQLAEMTSERLAAGAPFAPAEPLYLRRPDARVPGPPKPVTPR